MWYDNWFGLGIMGFALLAGIILFLGFYKTDLLKVGKKGKMWLKVVGVVMGFAVAVSYFGLNDVQSEEGNVVTEDPVWEVSVTETNTYLTYSEATHHFNYKMLFNDVGDAFNHSTGSFAISFLISNSAPTVTGVAIADIGTVGIVNVAGSSDEYILDQNSDDSFMAQWAKGSLTSWEKATLRCEAGDSGYLNVTFTLNPDAVKNMAENESVEFTFYVCGIEYSVTCWKQVDLS